MYNYMATLPFIAALARHSSNLIGPERPYKALLGPIGPYVDSFRPLFGYDLHIWALFGPYLSPSWALFGFICVD